MKTIHLAIMAVGTIVLLTDAAEAYTKKKSHCREFTRTIYIGGKPKEGVGRACLQGDGSWRIVSEAKLPATIRDPEPKRNVRTSVIHRNHYYPHYTSYPRVGYHGYYGPRSGISISLGKHWGHHGYGHYNKHYNRHYRKHHRRYHRGHAWHRYPKSRYRSYKYGHHGHHY